MKRKQFIYAALFICALFATSCSQDENTEMSQYELNQLHINITDMGISKIDDGKTRATTDDKYQTTFTDGDQIGLFAVKNGQIVDNIENVCLQYNATHKVWMPAGGSLSYSPNLEGAVYHAYYPYKEDVTTSFQANASDPFAELANNWIVGSDLSKENYAKSDLMTGAAQAELSGKNYTLELTMKHRLAMVVIQLPTRTYKFTNTEPTLSSYSIPASNPTFTVTKDGNATEEITPYYEEKTDMYRLLINPVTAYTISGRFTSGENKKYDIEITGINEGTYAPYTIDGGTQEITHELKIGDLYCSDGSLIPVDQLDGLSQDEKDKAIGVVYHIGTTDAIVADFPGCSHAIVHALARASDTKQRWGNASSVSDKTWFTGNLDKEDFSTIRGYQDTKYWKSIDNIGGSDVNSHMKSWLDAYEKEVPSGSTTGWYVPCLKEMRILEEQTNIINNSVSKAGGEELWKDATFTAIANGTGYWSSTIRGEVTIWQATGGGRDKDLAANFKNLNGFYRFSLAF